MVLTHDFNLKKGRDRKSRLAIAIAIRLLKSRRLPLGLMSFSQISMFSPSLRHRKYCSKIAVVMSISSSRRHTRSAIKTIGTVAYARESYYLYIAFVLTSLNRKKTPQHPVTLVAELTTLRRHMQSHHKVSIIVLLCNGAMILIYILGSLPNLG
jgi:hypothetical protein